MSVRHLYQFWMVICLLFLCFNHLASSPSWGSFYSTLLTIFKFYFRWVVPYWYIPQTGSYHRTIANSSILKTVFQESYAFYVSVSFCVSLYLSCLFLSLSVCLSVMLCLFLGLFLFIYARTKKTKTHTSMSIKHRLSPHVICGSLNSIWVPPLLS